MIKTCPKCGGENLSAATICRLCATPLPAQPPLEEPRRIIPATRPSDHDETPAGQKTASHPPISNSSEPQGSKCPVCHAVNDGDWLFCERCGGRLPGSEHAIDPQSLKDAVRSIPGAVKPSNKESQVQSDHKAVASDSTSSQATTSESQAVTDPNVSYVPSGTGDSTSSKGDGHDGSGTGKQPAARESARNMGLSTSVVCDSCGSIQPQDGLYCADCGAKLSPSALAKAAERGSVRFIGMLHLITEGGEVGETYELDRAETVIGRTEGHLKFPHDGYMSGRHARLVERDGRYFLIDDDSRNGTFIRIGKEIALEDGDTVLIGKQVLRFESS